MPVLGVQHQSDLLRPQTTDHKTSSQATSTELSRMHFAPKAPKEVETSRSGEKQLCMVRPGQPDPPPHPLPDLFHGELTTHGR